MAKGVEYRYIGNHPWNSESGSMLEPGAFVTLTDDQVNTDYVKAEIDAGGLIRVDPEVKSSG